MFANPGQDLGALWSAIDGLTEGALYALRYECSQHGWVPRIWAQTPEEGAPKGFTRFLFIGVDQDGLVQHFDLALAPHQPELVAQLKDSETLRETVLVVRHIKAGLHRIEQGLDPIPAEKEKAILALN